MSPALLWFFAGLLLILLEFVIPGLIVVFFGAGAWVNALLLVLFDYSPTGQFFVFLISSLASLLLLRRYSLRRLSRKSLEENLQTGAEVDVVQEISPGHAGSVFAEGTTWKAESEQRLVKGERVIILQKRGLVLIVGKRAAEEKKETNKENDT